MKSIYELNRMLRKELERTADPRVASLRVANRIAGVENLRMALVLALPAQAKVVARRKRNRVMGVAVLRDHAELAEATPDRYVPEFHDLLNDVRHMLDAPVSPTGDRWKALGDCTVDELRLLAERERHLSESHSNRADLFNSIADALTTHDARTVRNLPRLEAVSDAA